MAFDRFSNFIKIFCCSLLGSWDYPTENEDNVIWLPFILFTTSNTFSRRYNTNLASNRMIVDHVA